MIYRIKECTVYTHDEMGHRVILLLMVSFDSDPVTVMGRDQIMEVDLQLCYNVVYGLSLPINVH